MKRKPSRDLGRNTVETEAGTTTLFENIQERASLTEAMAGLPYGRSPTVGNPTASILKSNVYGIPALFGLNPVSNFMGFAVRVQVPNNHILS